MEYKPLSSKKIKTSFIFLTFTNIIIIVTVVLTLTALQHFQAAIITLFFLYILLFEIEEGNSLFLILIRNIRWIKSKKVIEQNYKFKIEEVNINE